MATGTREQDFEQHIEDYLTGHGYHAVAPQDYNPALGLVPGEVLAFIKETQPEAYAALQAAHGSDADRRLLLNLAKSVEKYGLVAVLREGLGDVSLREKVRLVYWQPASGLNAAHEALYQKNRFAVLRQVHYATVPKDRAKSLDLVLTLNGLPVLTAELKNALTGQYLTEATRQYREDRNPREPLLQYKRCLVHFAVSTEAVAMTTQLAGADTFFLPFNQELVNPPNAATGFTTAYLWEDVWATDSVLELAQHFVFEQTTPEEVYNPATGRLEERRSTRLLFPRFHQRRAVRRLLAAVRTQGAGQKYLIKHSAGSGKSNTIGWLAHRLAGFYQQPSDERALFDSVIVVTDRRLLNKQLGDTVAELEQTRGVVFRVQNDTPSSELKTHLEGGTRLIITTLQRFPVISATIAQVPGRRYAVLIDEAHSSQNGTAARHLRRALSLAEAEKEGEAEDNTDDLILQEIERSGPQPNVSFFAFTATPKPKTVQTFGTLVDGQKVPFDEYTMRQAIAEKFILDVLQSYTTYKRYYKLATRAAVQDAEYSIEPTVRLLSQFVDLQDDAIEAKARVMLDHFQRYTQKEIQGRARAMVVTRSRLHAVRYKRKLDQLIAEMNLPYGVLVAFSGTVTDAETGEDYTETGMNALPASTSIEQALKLPQYRLLVVANKFQTGFDEPLLHTMYVDKKLGDINTVQTLSRLNRMMRGKEGTLVLDFVNDPAAVQEDFQAYYTENFMREEEQTDPNLLYDLQRDVLGTGVVRPADLDEFAGIYLRAGDQMHQLQPILDRCVAHFQNDLAADEQQALRKAMQDYGRMYQFLSQVMTIRDLDLAKLYYLLSHLAKKLPVVGTELPREVLNEVKLVAYQLAEQGTANLTLAAEPGELRGMGRGGAGGGTEENYDYLSSIIKILNETFGGLITDEDQASFRLIAEQVESDADLAQAFGAPNSKQNLEEKFNSVVDKAILTFVNRKQGEFSDNLDLYNKLTADEANLQLKRLWFKQLFQARLVGSGAARP